MLKLKAALVTVSVTLLTMLVPAPAQADWPYARTAPSMVSAPVWGCGLKLKSCDVWNTYANQFTDVMAGGFYSQRAVTAILASSKMPADAKVAGAVAANRGSTCGRMLRYQTARFLNESYNDDKFAGFSLKVMNVAMMPAGYAGDIVWPTAETVAKLGIGVLQEHAAYTRPRAILFAADTLGCI